MATVRRRHIFDQKGDNGDAGDADHASGSSHPRENEGRRNGTGEQGKEESGLMAAPTRVPVAYSAEEALERLVAGNERFVRGRARFPTMRRKVLADLAKQQRPFATILGCSDSRVPPELVFDAGFGDLFVIRVAGNVISPEVFGTLQYAGVHLRTPLFVVLGHEECGAVQAALAAKFKGARERSRIARLLRNILPGLRSISAKLSPRDRLDAAVEANVRWSMHQLLETPEGRARTAEGEVRLVGAIYELRTGRVRFLA
jgi:carbonic anhydrase